MTVLITMAGLGSRFRKLGYTVPKYKIVARGRSLYEWSLLSLQDYFNQHFVLATLGLDDHGWLRNAAARLGIADVTVCSRDELSQGQAETAFDALEDVAANEPLWIYNIDTHVASGLHAIDLDGYDGCVPVYPSDSPSMSFVRFDERGKVVQVAEKTVISKWATVGMYGFKTATLYRDVYLDLYRRGEGVVGITEQYISPMYDHMLRSDMRLSAPLLRTDAVHVLGTPDEVLAFDPQARAPIGNTDLGS